MTSESIVERDQLIEQEQQTAEEAEQVNRFKRITIQSLLEQTFTPEQIAEIFDLPVSEIQDIIKTLK